MQNFFEQIKKVFMNELYHELKMYFWIYFIEVQIAQLVDNMKRNNSPRKTSNFLYILYFLLLYIN